jgi:hypothetical protein
MLKNRPSKPWDGFSFVQITVSIDINKQYTVFVDDIVYNPQVPRYINTTAPRIFSRQGVII